MQTISRPSENEYAPYFGLYIGQVPGDDVLSVLRRQLEETPAFIRNFPPDRQSYRYAEGKWTPKEVFIHILDAERVFAYRALRIGRGDKTPLPGFDQDIFVPESNAEDRSLESIAAEYENLRKCTLHLFENMQPHQVAYLGTASEKPVSPRALAYMTAGHELHHFRILHERYLV